MRLPLPQYESRDRQPNHIAEVIETSTNMYVAQCLEPEDLRFPTMPAFGSWLKTGDTESQRTIYGVVCHGTTLPIDSVHRARALGMSIDELREQQPQIFAMLKTEIRVALVGFRNDANAIDVKQSRSATIFQHLPAQPPQIHQAVYACSANEVDVFTDELYFLRTITQLGGVPVDELVAAVLRQVYRCRGLDRDWLVQAGRYLSILLKDDYDRLSAILAQVHV
ncbi:HerA-ATP synthase, barrel domain protein [Thalassoporum mexicanum PCC 7367]|uniref:hypothetical protein n=1 Tax=Thalassoporum mexicanum TaxID=3457544 RepID=UPI00029FD68D|nr:hypothetical protein [Pseudanabaena sp. PCC 7367]AFY69908.1 HerA-ATP synthase, barrel domain protein [Pseudanabaena sp. PCC 7367]